jgi:hypothetical protein
MCRLEAHLHKYVSDVQDRYGNVELISHQTQVFFEAVQFRLPGIIRVNLDPDGHDSVSYAKEYTYAMLFRSM